MKVKTDEIWEARIEFWPGDIERIMLIRIYYAWQNGKIQFVPALCYDGPPIWAESCYKFELVERMEVNDL